MSRRVKRRDIRGVLACIILLFAGGPRLYAQGTAGTPLPTSQATAPRIVGADFILPMRAIDWASYRPEACLAAVDRTIDSLGFDVIQDTVHVNLFRSVPPVAIAAGHACLQRIDATAAPGVVLPTLLQLGALIDDTTIVRTVVQRQLALLPGESVHARAAVLETAIRTLQEVHRTPAKTALARTLLQAADALGGEVAVERLAMYAAVEAPYGTFDPAKSLNYLQHRVAIVQQAPPDIQQQFTERRGELEGDRFGIVQDTWLATGREADFQRYLAAYRSFVVLPTPLMGHSAPAVTGAFWFNTDGTTPSVPVPGKINLVAFIDQGEIGELAQSQLRQRLRDLHHDFPDVQITLVAKTTGAFQGRLLVDHPDRESALIHAFVTDSLHLPGWLCIDSGSYHQLPTGAIVQLPTATMTRYDGGPDNAAMGQQFLIDQQGRVVQIGLEELDFDEFLIRVLQRTGPVSNRSQVLH